MSDPRIWSDSYWGMLHRGAIAYPEKPKEEDKMQAKSFYSGLAIFIPCPQCADHFREILKKTFNDSVVESSSALQKWLYDTHCAINDRLKIPNTVQFDDLKKMYNSFPSRYVDMDTGLLLTTPRFRYNYGVSQPTDEAPRKWLVENVGKSLDDRNLFAQLFTPLGEKQQRRSMLFYLAVAFLLTILASVYLTFVFVSSKEMQKDVENTQEKVEENNLVTNNEF